MNQLAVSIAAAVSLLASVAAHADKPRDRSKPAAAYDCAKRPTAVLNNGEGHHTFVGPCTSIVVNGGENTLSIESVEAIMVNGSGNTISIGSADRIDVMGSDNKITYRKGIAGAAPKIGSLGDRNQITQVK